MQGPSKVTRKKIEVTDSVCQPSSISQIKTGPIFAPAVDMHFALEPPSEKSDEKRCAPSISLLAKKQRNRARAFEEHALEKSNAENTQGPPLAASLLFHKLYLKKRLEKTAGYVSTKQLFKEITARGYRGDVKVLQSFLFTIRTKAPEEASLTFHKDYLIKRLRESGSERGAVKQLFQEIKAKGYQGAYKTVRIFLAAMRTKVPEEAFLKFHKDYLIKKVKESPPYRGLAKQLFQEIKAKGYQGAFSTVQGFLSTTCGKKKMRKTSLDFHKEYLKTRLEEATPSRGLAKQLFQEITDRGYRGSIRTLQLFLATIRANKNAKKQTSAPHPITNPCAEDPFYIPVDVASDLNALFDGVVGKDFLHSPFFLPLHSINSLPAPD